MAPKHKLPTTKALLAEVGTIALKHGQLDNALRMMVLSLIGMSREDALHATPMQGSRELRERVRQ